MLVALSFLSTNRISCSHSYGCYSITDITISGTSGFDHSTKTH